MFGRSKGKRFVVINAIFLVLLHIAVSTEDSTSAQDDDKSVAPTEENDVLVLTSNNFDDIVYSKDVILVEFYAPWCGHCKQLAPEYEKAAKSLKENDPPVPLAKVDATVESELAGRFDVSGYPTLKFFKNGQAYDYDGPRNEQGIVEFMKERAKPDWKPPPSALLVLTKDNFTEVVEREELMLVMFYAPWCGHCKRALPEFEKAAKEVKDRWSPVIPLAKVDATVETDLANKYGVNGYPTTKVFRKGKAYDYKEQIRDHYGVLRTLESLKGPASKELKIDDIPKQFGKSDDSAILIVGFFGAATDKAFVTYDEATNEMRGDYEFTHSFEMEEAAKKYKVEPGSLVVFISQRFQSSYEPKWHVLKIEDDSTSKDITDFLSKHNTPLVGQYGRFTKQKIYATKRPLVLFFYTVDWSFDHREATQAWRLKFCKIAKEFPSLTFAIAHDDSDDTRDLIKEFNIDETTEEIAVGIIDEKERKYLMSELEEFDHDEVKKFIKRFLKGDLKPKIKSQPIPKKQPGPVTVVVGKTFEKIVLDNSKDVLIELYAPWCGHCKKLEPVYRDLAKRFKNSKRLVIAKMDATANDSPDPYSANGYPTIYFAPAGSKKSPIPFSGSDRSLEGLTTFIREHATVPLHTKDEL